jgi:hypothetical protein
MAFFILKFKFVLKINLIIPRFLRNDKVFAILTIDNVFSVDIIEPIILFLLIINLIYKYG